MPYPGWNTLVPGSLLGDCLHFLPVCTILSNLIGWHSWAFYAGSVLWFRW